MDKVIGALKEQFTADNPGVTVTYDPTGSGAGIEAVSNGSCDIGLASRALTDDEKAGGLTETIVALDGIAVIVNAENPVSDLTLEQIASIYTGAVTDWSEVGREAGSGTRSGFEELTETVDKCKYRQELTSTGDVITAVAQNPDAIGYASLSAVQDQKGITVLTVGGVAPSEATVLDGSYAIQRPFVFATRTDEALSDAAQAFFDFATSTAASDLIANAGAVPVAMTVPLSVPRVVAAMHRRIVGELAREERLDGGICLALHAAVERDTRRLERLLRPATDTAADERIDAALLEEECERPVPLSVRIDDLRGRDLPVCDLVNLELARLAEMLENGSMLIRDCDLHDRSSFPVSIHKYLPIGSPATAAGCRADRIRAARDEEGPPLDECRSDPLACGDVKRLHRRPGDLHLRRALLLREAEVIHEADRLILLDSQIDRRRLVLAPRVELREAGQRAHPALLRRPRHILPPSTKHGRRRTRLN